MANGQKEKEKEISAIAVGAELKLPWTLAHSSDLSLLDISREDAYIASLKQIPFYSSVCQIGQVSNPVGLSALKCLCE